MFFGLMILARPTVHRGGFFPGYFIRSLATHRRPVAFRVAIAAFPVSHSAAKNFRCSCLVRSSRLSGF